MSGEYDVVWFLRICMLGSVVWVVWGVVGGWVVLGLGCFCFCVLVLLFVLGWLFVEEGVVVFGFCGFIWVFLVLRVCGFWGEEVILGLGIEFLGVFIFVFEVFYVVVVIFFGLWLMMMCCLRMCMSCVRWLERVFLVLYDDVLIEKLGNNLL